MPRNNARTWTIVSVILTIAGTAMILAGIWLDDFNWYWLIMVGLLLGLTFLISSFIFAAQARRLDRLFRHDRELLAHWTFPIQEKQAAIDREMARRQSGNRAILLIVIVFFVVIGGLFLLFGFDDWDEALLFLAIMLGVLGLVTLAAFLAPWLAHRRHSKSQPDVYVGLYSAWVMGEYVQWKAPLTRLNRVLLGKDKQGLVIDIDFALFQRYGYQQHHCRIPVPEGHENEASQVAEAIAAAGHVPLVPLDQ